MSTRLSEALATLRHRYGDAVVHRGDAAGETLGWPSGIPAIDGRLAPGGLPLGRLSLLTGSRRGPSGRLTLLQALAAAASREGPAVYVDLSGSVDPGFLADLGADLSSLLVVTPPPRAWAEGVTAAHALARAGAPWLGIALSGPPPRSPLWEARLTALLEAVAARRTAVLVSSPPPPPALAYASSLTLECAAAGWQEHHGDVTGLRVRVSVAKSKVGAPGAVATLLLRYPRTFAAGEVVAHPAVVELPAPPSQAEAPAHSPATGLAV